MTPQIGNNSISVYFYIFCISPVFELSELFSEYIYIYIYDVNINCLYIYICIYIYIYTVCSLYKLPFKSLWCLRFLKCI